MLPSQLLALLFLPRRSCCYSYWFCSCIAVVLWFPSRASITDLLPFVREQVPSRSRQAQRYGPGEDLWKFATMIAMGIHPSGRVVLKAMKVANCTPEASAASQGELVGATPQTRASVGALVSSEAAPGDCAGLGRRPTFAICVRSWDTIPIGILASKTHCSPYSITCR